MRWFVIVFCILLVAFCTFHAAPLSTSELTSVDQVLNRYVDAVGGREAIERLTTRHCVGKYVEDLPYKEPPRSELPFEASAILPGRWRMEVQGAGDAQANGCDGEVGWRMDRNGVRRDDPLCRSLTALHLDPHGPLRLGEYFSDLTLAGMRMLASGEAYEVEGAVPGGETRSLYFNADSGLLVQYGKHTFLRDYRGADGVLVPHRLEISRKGGFSAFVFDSVEHNRPVDPARCSMPDPSEILEAVFAGIGDARVLPMLKDLPYEHGGMNVPAADGRLLYDLIVKNGYRRGLEIGTSNGYSTLWLGLAFRETGGRLITLEYDPQAAAEARANFSRAGLDEVIDARTADAFEEIPAIEGDFDFVFLDAWKPDYIRFWKLVKDRVPPGGAFTAHNVIQHENHMREFLQAIQADPAFETAINRTSSAGVSISIRRK